MNNVHHIMSRLRVAVAGLGAVGLPVAEKLVAKPGIPGLVLTAVSASSSSSAASKLEKLEGGATACISKPEELHAHADVVLEALPPSAFLSVAEPTLRAGKTLVVLSVTQSRNRQV